MYVKPLFSDIDTTARTLYGEARGEMGLGKKAVAYVIKNRAKKAFEYVRRKKKNHPLFGDGTLKSACLRPYQFSCWNPSDPNSNVLRSRKHEEFMDDPVFQKCFNAVLDMIESDDDPTFGSAHYYSTLVFKGNNVPAWARNKTPVCRIGNHVFFNDIE